MMVCGVNRWHDLELICDPDIRIEWTKAHARAERWREELILLEEEMRRVLVFCQWKAEWWDRRQQMRAEVDSELAEGLAAYAKEQAARERFWAADWETKWVAVRARALLVAREQLVDATWEVGLEVEIEEEVAYGECESREGDMEDLD